MAFWFVAVCAVIVALIVLALLSRIRIRIRYSRSGRFDHVALIVRALYGIVRYKLEIPSIMIRGWNVMYRQKTSGNIPGQHSSRKVRRPIAPGQSSRVSKMSRRSRSLRPVLLRTLKKVECTRFRLDLRVGTGDAPSTAVLSGVLWSLHGCALALTGQTVRLKTAPYGGVRPVYQSEEFSLVWEADFRLRVATALWSALTLGGKAVSIGRTIRYWRRELTAPEQA